MLGKSQYILPQYICGKRPRHDKYAMVELTVVHAWPSANRLGSLREPFTWILKGTLLKHDVPSLLSRYFGISKFYEGKKDESLTTGEI